MAGKKKDKPKKGSSGKRYRGAEHRRKVGATSETKRKRTPRSRPLPGMGQVRDKALDNLCEALNDVRTTMNEARGEESVFKHRALARMIGREVTIYKHAGIELARVPGGDEQLRVRQIKDKGDASVATPVERVQVDEPEEVEPDRFEATGEGDDVGSGLDEVH